MITIKRKNLPLEIKYRGKFYKFEAAQSAIDDKNMADLCIEVLSSRLEGKTDLHGNLYTPRNYYFKEVKQ